MGYRFWAFGATLVACSLQPLVGNAETNDDSAGKVGPIDYGQITGKVSFITNDAKEHAAALLPIDPFLNSALPNPPTSEYNGRLFELRHDYPESLPPPIEYPWRKVTGGGPITQGNAQAYVNSVKDYLATDMQRLLFHYDRWNPKVEPWWHSIWLGTEREPIHGLYVGSTYPAGTLTDQALSLTTYMYVLYNRRAAKTQGDIWGRTFTRAMNPKLETESTQYVDGSVVVKFAFVTSCGSDWSPMQGAARWTMYNTLNSGNGSGHSSTSQCPNNGSAGSVTQPTPTYIYLMQTDMIVKDPVASPATGWVFSSLVYDKDAPGNNAWDKMVVLGATWGGNPNVVDTGSRALTPPVSPNPALTENWVNPDAPEYAVVTLGWDGRLSGPNDGAVVVPAWSGSHYFPRGLASAGCLGCHSSAQYPMQSFLLPATVQPPQVIAPPGSSAASSAGALVLNVPGSVAWMKWFQSRPGSVPMDSGSVPLDYDMVTATKSIPMWLAAKQAEKSSK